MADKNDYINISTSTDPFYRYKMPKIQCKHEGKGNGVKTVLKNLKDVGKTLNRDPIDLLSFIASELSVCSLHKNEDFTVMGTFSTERIQEVLSKFVKSHVTCDECGNPETDFVVKSGKKGSSQLRKTCNACGGTSDVKEHKINKRIISAVANAPV